MYSGTIITQNRKVVRLRAAGGRKLVIRKSRIRRISYGRTGDAKIERERRARLALKRRERARRDLERKRLAEKKRERDRQRLAEEKRRHERTRIEKLKRRQDRKRLEETRRKKEPGRTGVPNAASASLRRSALLPGWGQWARGDKNTGRLFAGGAMLTGLILFQAEQALKAAERDSNELANPLSLGLFAAPLATQLQDPVFLSIYSQPFGRQRARTEGRLKTVRNAGLALLAVYGWNLIDAYFFHPAGSSPEPGPGAARPVRRADTGWSVLPVVCFERREASGMGKPSTPRHELRFSRRIQF